MLTEVLVYSCTLMIKHVSIATLTLDQTGASMEVSQREAIQWQPKPMPSVHLVHTAEEKWRSCCQSPCAWAIHEALAPCKTTMTFIYVWILLVYQPKIGFVLHLLPKKTIMVWGGAQLYFFIERIVKKEGLFHQTPLVRTTKARYHKPFPLVDQIGGSFLIKKSFREMINLGIRFGIVALCLSTSWSSLGQTKSAIRRPGLVCWL